VLSWSKRSTTIGGRLGWAAGAAAAGAAGGAASAAGVVCVGTGAAAAIGL